jgi:hypothetical protein
MPQTIDALYAWVATNPDGNEGICSVIVDGRHTPMVFGSLRVANLARRDIEALRLATGVPVRLVRFSRREDLEELP